MSERTINVNAEWYETVTAELKAKDKRIAHIKRISWELKAKVQELEEKLRVSQNAGRFAGETCVLHLKRIEELEAAAGDEDTNINTRTGVPVS